METGNNNHHHNNNNNLVLVANFKDYYKVIFGDDPALQTNRSDWFSPWGGHLRQEATVSEICNEIKNHEHKLFVVFLTKNGNMKVLHGLFYDDTAFSHHHKVVGWDTTIILQIVNNANQYGRCYDTPVWAWI